MTNDESRNNDEARMVAGDRVLWIGKRLGMHSSLQTSQLGAFVIRHCPAYGSIILLRIA